TSATQTSGGFIGSTGSYIGGGTTVGGQPNNPTGQQPVYAGQMPSPYNTAPGSNAQPPGFPNPANTTGQANPALGMINNILTSPRPGGLAGIQQQNQIGGGQGIAGVASNLDADSIMEYADHTNYSEWEFIYDGKYMPPPDPRQGTGGTPVNQMGSMPGGGPGGTPVSQMASPGGFGQSMGGPGGFGQNQQQPGQQGQPG